MAHKPLCIVFNVRFHISKLIIKNENFMIFEFREKEKLEVTTMFKNLTNVFPLLPSQSKYISIYVV